MTDVSFQNVYMTYILNDPYHYPSVDVPIIITGTHQDAQTINTGWHIIPNFLWRHCLTPKQWCQLVINYEAYRVKGMKCVLYNPIPITSNLSLQRINTFSAFNNCTYGLTFTDKIYETSWYPWEALTDQYRLNLGQREGMQWYGQQTNAEEHLAAKRRYIWPQYFWTKPRATNIFDNMWSQGKTGQAGVFDNKTATNSNGYDSDNVALPNGVYWDPFNLPEEIGEFRAGKNSVEFDWTVHEADSGKWFNIDQMAQYTTWTARGPYCGVGRPGTNIITGAMDPEVVSTWGRAQMNTEKDPTTGAYRYDDYTVPNMFNMPICQTTWFWKEIQQSIIDVDEVLSGSGAQSMPQPHWRKPDKYWPGTEYEAYKYPPWQWFCKGIPLFDEHNEHIKTSTQVSVQISLYLECKKRRSAYYCPTWGPTSGEEMYYMTHKRGIFQLPMLRYRTGGARMTWQNIQRPRSRDLNTQQDLNWRKEHPREDPYNVVGTGTTYYAYGTFHRPAGIPDAQTTTTKVKAGRPSKTPNIKVTFNAATDETEIIMDDEETDEQS